MATNGGLLSPSEIWAQRAWADKEGRPEIIAVFEHLAIREQQFNAVTIEIDAFAHVNQKTCEHAVCGLARRIKKTLSQ